MDSKGETKETRLKLSFVSPLDITSYWRTSIDNTILVITIYNTHPSLNLLIHDIDLDLAETKRSDTSTELHVSDASSSFVVTQINSLEQIDSPAIILPSESYSFVYNISPITSSDYFDGNNLSPVNVTWSTTSPMGVSQCPISIASRSVEWLGSHKLPVDFELICKRLAFATGGLHPARFNFNLTNFLKKQTSVVVHASNELESDLNSGIVFHENKQALRYLIASL